MRQDRPVPRTTTATPAAAGQLVAWANAWLTGAEQLRSAVAAAVADLDACVVIGLPGTEPGEQAPLAWGLGQLRTRGASSLELVLPVAGDVRGIPRNDGALTASALHAGAVVLTRGIPERLALVPSVETTTTPDGPLATLVLLVLETGEPDLLAPPLLTVAEAGADLREATTAAIRAMTELGTTSWRPELTTAVARLRSATRRPGAVQALPGCVPGAARDLLTRAEQLAAIVELASEDDGGAVQSVQVQARNAALRELGTAVRRARTAAHNALPGTERVRSSIQS